MLSEGSQVEGAWTLQHSEGTRALKVLRALGHSGTQGTSGTWGFETLIGAVAQTCSIKKVFLEILQRSQKNTSARISFLITLQVSVMQLY